MCATGHQVYLRTLCASLLMLPGWVVPTPRPAFLGVAGEAAPAGDDRATYCTNPMRLRPVEGPWAGPVMSTVDRRSSRALPKPVISARRISRGGIWAVVQHVVQRFGVDQATPVMPCADHPGYRLRAMVRA